MPAFSPRRSGLRPCPPGPRGSGSPAPLPIPRPTSTPCSRHSARAPSRTPRNLRERPISRALAFVLVHGWGFNAGIWRELVRHLPGAEISFVDLGFIRGGPKGIDTWPENAIAVGHSLGALWLLTTVGEQAP